MGKAARLRRQVERRSLRLAAKNEEALLHRLVEVAPKHIDALACRTTIECIEAAVIGLLVLKRLGIAAVERPVAVDALNAPMAEALRAGRDPFTGWDRVHAVSMGHEGGLRTPTQWQGHLIVWTASGWLVDLWPLSRRDMGINLPLAFCLPARTLPATYSMPDGALVAYYDKPENVFYKLAQTWPDGFPEWGSTIDAIVEEVSGGHASARGDALFTRCSDDLGIREYVEAYFNVLPPEHVWDLARAYDVPPERIWEVKDALDVISEISTQGVIGEERLAMERELRALGG